MQWRNTSHTYGAVAKFLHWSIVILIIAQYVIIESAEELADGPEKLAVIARHKSLGMLVLLLARPQARRAGDGVDLWVLVDHSESAKDLLQPRLAEWEAPENELAALESTPRSGSARG
mgnify:CR=1 FL=1